MFGYTLYICMIPLFYFVSVSHCFIYETAIHCWTIMIFLWLSFVLFSLTTLLLIDCGNALLSCHVILIVPIPSSSDVHKL